MDQVTVRHIGDVPYPQPLFLSDCLIILSGVPHRTPLGAPPPLRGGQGVQWVQVFLAPTGL